MADTVDGMPRKKKSEPTIPVRVLKSVGFRLRRIASHLQEDPGDYIARNLAEALDRDEAKMMKDMAKEKKAKGNAGGE